MKESGGKNEGGRQEEEGGHEERRRGGEEGCEDKQPKSEKQKSRNRVK